MKLGVETLAGNALHGFVETPVATARHDADTVDREGEVFGVGDGVSDLAVAEVSGLFVGGDPSLSGLEGEGELVEVLRAIAVGPPEFGVDDVGITLSGMGLAVSAPPSHIWCADQSASTRYSVPLS